MILQSFYRLQRSDVSTGVSGLFCVLCKTSYFDTQSLKKLAGVTIQRKKEVPRESLKEMVSLCHFIRNPSTNR